MFGVLLSKNRYLFDFSKRDSYLFMHFKSDFSSEGLIKYFEGILHCYFSGFWACFWSWRSLITSSLLTFQCILVISSAIVLALGSFWSWRLQFRRHCLGLSCWLRISETIRSLGRIGDRLWLIDCYRVFIGKEPFIEGDILHWCYRCCVGIGLGFQI